MRAPLAVVLVGMLLLATSCATLPRAELHTVLPPRLEPLPVSTLAPGEEGAVACLDAQNWRALMLNWGSALGRIETLETLILEMQR